MQNIPVNFEENYLSTTMIAKNYGIKNPRDFVAYLEKINLIYRDKENQLKLTQEAFDLGGKYKIGENGESWIVWKENSLDKFLLEFVKSQNLEMSLEPIENSNTLNETQKLIHNKVIEFIINNKNNILKSTNLEDYQLSLTGSAGTGKTFLTTQIVKTLESMKIVLAVTAPTHKAASVLSELFIKNKLKTTPRTIHSFLNIKPFIDYEKGIESFKPDKTKKESLYIDVLIVDESSMIGIELYDYILEEIEKGRVGTVLFVGDPNQLLPINGENSSIYKLKNQYKLTEIVRQAKDSYIISIANKIKNMIENKSYIPVMEFFNQNLYDEIRYFNNEKDFLDDFYKNEKWYFENKIIATHTNKDVDAFNKQVRRTYWNQKNIYELDTFRVGDWLRFNDLYSVKGVTLYNNGEEIEIESVAKLYHEALEIWYWEVKAKNSRHQQKFRVVDPDYLKVYNDKLSAIANLAKRATFPENKNFWKIFFQTRDMFANVQYIFASTMHKLQGSTYEQCYINLFDLAKNRMSLDDKYRLIYVAITRASKDIKIFISKLDEEVIQLNNLDTDKYFENMDFILLNTLQLEKL
ncbi:ATP-dependent DNA helicase [Aliarcobacter cryaerophilus]|uniref:ATP-dependent DNA helicase n=2 Tax=Arcobacteraceae TaxID=2808963 RepID=UPI0021B5866D|nr:AAA family ATPase [Aliarcobacter cryaerophilus]MCT7519187.1 AAA family ATPase [Aliarcobacter cryaerophilus]